MSEQMQLFPFDAKGRRGRIEHWTSCTAEELWLRWREQFESDDEAIATAVWMCNRLVKEAARPTRSSFYSIKDAFIARYAKEGKRVREEVRKCWGCDGSGIDPFDDACPRCDGTGVYSSRWLFLYEFEVAGRRYSLHSYVEPATLLEEPGGDAEVFGGRFEGAELKSLALPMSGLLKVLRYVAAALWKMQSYDGKYY